MSLAASPTPTPSSFIGGEVKRPDKTHHPSELLRHPRAGRVHALDGHHRSTRRWASSSSTRRPGSTTTAVSTGQQHAVRAPASSSLAVYAITHSQLASPSWPPATWASRYMVFTLWWIALSLPRLPAHPLRVGHGPHGPQVVHRHQPALGQPGQELHPLLRPRRGVCSSLYYTLAQQPDAGPHHHRLRDDLGVHPHGHRGPDLPLRQAGQGHLGLLAVQDLEVPRHPGRGAGAPRSTSSTSASSSTSSSSPTRPSSSPRPATCILVSALGARHRSGTSSGSRRSKRVGVDVGTHLRGAAAGVSHSSARRLAGDSCKGPGRRRVMRRPGPFSRLPSSGLRRRRCGMRSFCGVPEFG